MTTTPTVAAQPAPQGAPAAAAPQPNPLDGAITGLSQILGTLGRNDLVARVTAAGARLKRPNTIVCVVGEFKQGKSSLVNALLGADVCPVDDDLATSAITLVRYADQASAVVRRKENDQQVAQQVPVNELSQWCSERGNPGNEKGVERVELALPSAMLKQGLMIVDTPGMGGLGAGHAAATLAFLPFADGLVLASDASAELSAPEIDFMRRAVELCPTVLFAQTKIDLYPSWPRIFDLNRGHLAAAGLDVPMVAVSSVLRHEAIARKDRALNESSHFPELITAIGDRVVTPAKQTAAVRSAGDVKSIAGLVRTGLEQEQELLKDPTRLQNAIAELNEAKEKLDHLRGPGARWATLLADRVGDLSSSINHDFRGSMRSSLRDMDERIETLKTGTEWDAVVRDLQSAVADTVTNVFVALEQGRLSIRNDIAELLRDENLGLPNGRGGKVDPIDVHELWQDKALDEKGGRGGKALQRGLTGIRGAQGGMVLLGTVRNFLPTTTATLLAANPVLLGTGAVFGGMQLLEERKRKIAMRRQNARQQVRQFVDDVQFEIGDQLTGSIRDLQRDLRDEFTERITELQRTFMETATRAQETAKTTQEQQQQRAAQLQQQLQVLGQIEQIAAAAGGARS
jgi:hypothetical protein